MKFKGNINYVVKTSFLNNGNNVTELLSQLIYDDFKKDMSYESR